VEKEGWSAEITEATRAKDAPRLERLLASGAYDVNALGERSRYMSVALTVAQEDEEAGIALFEG
jgi:hypothetical protein